MINKDNKSQFNQPLDFNKQKEQRSQNFKTLSSVTSVAVENKTSQEVPKLDFLILPSDV